MIVRPFASWAKCPECPLRDTGCHSPKMKGRGPLDQPDLLVVGEAPGDREDAQGKPFCLEESTLILYADLKWKPLGEAKVGDRLIAVDEHCRPSTSGASKFQPRRWRISEILEVHHRAAQCWTVATEQRHLTGTPEHRVLTKGTRKAEWLRLDQLQSLWRKNKSRNTTKRASSLIYLVPPTHIEPSFDAGWLAGFLDEEGHILGSKKDNIHSRGHIGFSQNLGPLLDRAETLLKERGFELRVREEARYKDNTCGRVGVKGGPQEAIRLLSLCPAQRLISDFESVLQRNPMQIRGTVRAKAKVQSIYPAGPKLVVDVKTTTGTFLANGFVVHNCGDSGDALENALEKVGFDRSRVRYTYAVRCRPPNNNTPDEAVIKACSPALAAEIKTARPKVVLLAGATALRSIGKGSSVANNRGKWFERRGVYYVPTWHPAKLLREKNPQSLGEFADDLNTVLEISRNGAPKVVLPDNVHICVTIDEVRQEMALMLDATPKKVAFDFEATGLRPEKPGFQVLSCGFSWGEGYGPPVDDLPYRTFVVPLFHQQSPLTVSEREEALEYIREFARAEHLTKVVHNVYYEYQVLWSHLGVELAGRVLDTLHLDAQRDETVRHNLELLSWKTPYRGWKELSETYLRGLKKKDRRYGDIPLIVYQQELDVEKTREVNVAYSQDLSEYLAPLQTKALESGRRYLRKVFKATQDFNQATEAAQAKIKELLVKAVRASQWTETTKTGEKTVHKKPIKPAPITRDTCEVVGGLAMYNGVDAHATRWLEEKFETPAVLKRGTMQVYEETLEPAFSVLSKMMARGVQVDRLFLTYAQGHFQQELDRLRADILKKPELNDWPEFNPDSGAQVAELLYGRLGYRLSGKEYEETGGFRLTEGGQKKITSGLLPLDKLSWKDYSTDAVALENLAHKHKGLPRLLLKWSKVGTAKGTFVDSFLDSEDGHIQWDGKVHTSFTAAGPRTGRLASRDPNLMNIPSRPYFFELTKSEFTSLEQELGEEQLVCLGFTRKDDDRNHGEPMEIFHEPGCDYVLLKDGTLRKGITLKKMFISSWEGGYIVDADYAGIELRVLASITKCRQLILDLITGKGDVHRMTASTIFGIPPEKVTYEMRQRAKTALFSIIYGKTVHGLALALEISDREAAKIVMGIFARYPEVKYYIEACHEFIRKNGYVQNVDGRIRKFPGVWSNKQSLINAAFREGFNHEVQGPASDITLKAIVRLWNFLEKHGFKARPILLVHDDIGTECPPKERDQVYQIQKTIMEDAPTWMQVPTKVDIRACKTWGDPKDMNYYGTK